MEPNPQLILLVAQSISAKDMMPLLLSSRGWAQRLTEPRLAELLQEFGGSWARDLFIAAPDFKTVLKREDLAAEAAWCQRGRRETPTDMWLHGLVGLRPPPRSPADPRRVLRLLGTDTHSTALWTCACAALLCPDVKLKEAEPMRFLIKLERTMKTNEDEGLFEFGLDLLVELYRAVSSKWSRPCRHFNTGLQLASRALLLWPENRCMVDSAFEVACSCLTYNPEPPRRLVKAFAERLKNTLHKHPYLERHFCESLDAVLDLQSGSGKEFASLLSDYSIPIGIDARQSGRSAPVADSSALVQ